MTAQIYNEGLLGGRRYLVTGGGSGIGRALATAFAKLGATVYIAGRRGLVLDAAAAEIATVSGSRVCGLVCDVRDATAVERTIERIWADGGPLDGLVNSAAGNFIAPTESVSARAFETVTDIQFRGAFYVTTACGRRWIRDGHRASVISILATDVRGGGPFHVPAIMAKAGVEAMTRSLAVEWGGYGLRFNAIAPGVLRTEGADTRLGPLSAHGWSGSRNPMKRIGDIDEIQNLGVFLMSDASTFISGETIAMDGAGQLASGATFSDLASLTPADWAAVRAESKAATDLQKPLRSGGDRAPGGA